MGHSKAEKAASRDRILDQAARTVRREGIPALAIAPLMESAGLTHGAFYGHFGSRAALPEAAVARALDDGEARFRGHGASPDLGEIVRRYLSRVHRDNAEDGCGVVALAGEVRDDATLRALVADRARTYKRQIEEAAEDDGDGWAMLATMVGGLLLARVLDGRDSDEVLTSARNAILSRRD